MSSDTVHFKLTHNGDTRRFAFARSEKFLLFCVREKVSEIVGVRKERVSIAWKDAASAAIAPPCLPLGTVEDLERAIAHVVYYNSIGSTTRNMPPCIHLVVTDIAPEVEKQQKSAPTLRRCTLCNEYQTGYFVSCLSNPGHKFCFPCTRSVLKQQIGKKDLQCPSGERCPAEHGSLEPWAFDAQKLEQILGEEYAKFSKTRQATRAAVAAAAMRAEDSVLFDLIRERKKAPVQEDDILSVHTAIKGFDAAELEDNEDNMSVRTAILGWSGYAALQELEQSLENEDALSEHTAYEPSITGEDSDEDDDEASDIDSDDTQDEEEDARSECSTAYEPSLPDEDLVNETKDAAAAPTAPATVQPVFQCFECEIGFDNQTGYVYCSRDAAHKFCMTCSTKFIKKHLLNQPGCPSGEQCGWTLNESSLKTILGLDFYVYMQKRLDAAAEVAAAAAKTAAQPVPEPVTSDPLGAMDSEEEDGFAELKEEIKEALRAAGATIKADLKAAAEAAEKGLHEAENWLQEASEGAKTALKEVAVTVEEALQAAAVVVKKGVAEVKELFQQKCQSGAEHEEKEEEGGECECAALRARIAELEKKLAESEAKIDLQFRLLN